MKWMTDEELDSIKTEHDGQWPWLIPMAQELKLARAVIDRASKLKFGVYPAHGSGFVMIVLEGNCDLLKEDIDAYDEAKAMAAK